MSSHQEDITSQSFMERQVNQLLDEAQRQQIKVDINLIIDFDQNLLSNKFIKKLLEMSPSIPNGFDMNCTKLDLMDTSSIITQALLSNDHILALKSQGFMNMDSKLQKEKFLHKKMYSGVRDQELETLGL